MKRLIKFSVVGASGVAVNIGLLWLLTEVAGMFYIVSAAASIEASIITNFLLNDRWTFSDRRGGSGMPARGLKFNTVSLVAMAVNIAVLFVMTEYTRTYYIISELFGICAGLAFNFLLNLKWTYGKN